MPGHVVAYYDPGNDTTVRLPDPEWDRIEELSQRLEELQAQVAALEDELAAARTLGSRRSPRSQRVGHSPQRSLTP